MDFNEMHFSDMDFKIKIKIDLKVMDVMKKTIMDSKEMNFQKKF